MKTLTINAGAVNISTTVKTIVTKIFVKDGVTYINLDALSKIDVGLHDQAIEELDLQVNQTVTLKPLSGDSRGNIVMEIGEVEAKKPTAAPSRGTSPLPGMTLSNNI